MASECIERFHIVCITQRLTANVNCDIIECAGTTTKPLRKDKVKVPLTPSYRISNGKDESKKDFCL